MTALGEMPPAMAAKKWTVLDMLHIISWHESHHHGQAHITSTCSRPGYSIRRETEGHEPCRANSLALFLTTAEKCRVYWLPSAACLRYNSLAFEHPSLELKPAASPAYEANQSVNLRQRLD